MKESKRKCRRLFLRRNQTASRDGILWRSQGECTWTGAEICVSPLFFSCLRKYLRYQSNTTTNTTWFKTAIKQLEKWDIMAFTGGIHISLNQRSDMCIPSLFFDFSSYSLLNEICQSYVINATSDIVIITLDKERNVNECLHQHCGPRSKLARNSSLCDYFVLNRCSFVIMLFIILNHL